MTEFAYDHVHLRSPDLDETAAYYERMFGAEIIKSVMSNGCRAPTSGPAG
jgi:catechol 2,3-dioxygenase-like lactoylglutathione lyase family enzyme